VKAENTSFTLKRLLSRLPAFLLYSLARYRKTSIVRQLGRLARLAYERSENLYYDHHKNGEWWLLRRLSTSGVKTVFDVGANMGHWTRLARKAFPNAQIHCFEIVEPTFKKLQENLDGVPNVVFNNIGLSDQDQEVEVRHYPDNSGLSTLFSNYAHRKASTILKAWVTSGANYMTSRGILRIDLLKIDVEGAEHLVLEGFAEAIACRKVDVIQVEYGKINIVTKFLLRDIYEFFTQKGYRVGKLYPSYVDFKDYETKDENFLGPNYVAVNGDRPDLVALLS